MLSSDLPFLSSFAGSFRNDGLKAADVLPILKEKVAFVSGECILPGSLYPSTSTGCCVLVLMVHKFVCAPYGSCLDGST